MTRGLIIVLVVATTFSCSKTQQKEGTSIADGPLVTRIGDTVEITAGVPTGSLEASSNVKAIAHALGIREKVVAYVWPAGMAAFTGRIVINGRQKVIFEIEKGNVKRSSRSP